MRIEIRLFAGLRRHAPPEAQRGRFSLTLHQGAALAQVLLDLGIDPGAVAVLLINGAAKSQLETLLSPGDVVSLFPPVAGG